MIHTEGMDHISSLPKPLYRTNRRFGLYHVPFDKFYFLWYNILYNSPGNINTPYRKEMNNMYNKDYFLKELEKGNDLDTILNSIIEEANTAQKEYNNKDKKLSDARLIGAKYLDFMEDYYPDLYNKVTDNSKDDEKVIENIAKELVSSFDTLDKYKDTYIDLFDGLEDIFSKFFWLIIKIL